MTEIHQSGSFALRARQHQQQRAAFWDAAAGKVAMPSRLQRWVQAWYAARVPPGSRVLEVGCGAGGLRAALRPTFGLGVDLSERWLRIARRRFPREAYPNLRFLCADGLDLPVRATFDCIILSGLLDEQWDVQGLLAALHRCCHPRTRLFLDTTRPRLPGPAARPPFRGGLSAAGLRGLLALAGFEVVRDEARLLPLPHFGLAHFFEARPAPESRALPARLPSVSVIIPARNESGNIRELIERIPRMGSATEVIFVEGHSCDDTRAEIERQIQAHPALVCRLACQQGRGKGDAVRLGFELARGDILMILDADLTVPPEYLPRFYQALLERRGELVNGVRLDYPMEQGAMRRANLLGNRFFSLAVSWLLGQPVRDTLCGTKALYREDYRKIARGRAFFGDLDPFGDFDLLFGAARLKLRIVDLPIRYQRRTYRSTNIQRWKDGWLLLKMLVAAAVRLKLRRG